jgi:putative acetyltransferase
MVRQMQDEDIGRVEEIWYQESVRDHKWMDDPNDFWNRRRQTFRKDTEEADAKSVFEENGIIKGFITCKGNLVLELFVDHSYQRRGIGSALIKHLMETKQLLHANVYMLNYRAIRFYIRNDFVITGLYAEERTGFAKFVVEWKIPSPAPV